MDYDKLIHCLKCCARVDAQNVGCDDCGLEYCGEECQQLCGTAATALSTLQGENEKLRNEADGMRSNWYKAVEEIKKLRAELEQVKEERDAAVDCIYQIEDDLDRGSDNDWAREHIAEWESQKED